MTGPPHKRSDTRARIMEAASKQFADRGFDGARTQAIADGAGVNKAMLYYYFRNKEDLYVETLSYNFVDIFSRVFPTLMQQDLPARERLLATASAYHRFLSTRPELSSMILQELAAGGPRLVAVLENVKMKIPDLDIVQVFKHIQLLIDSGELRNGDPRQVLLHLLSLTVFPFFARPLLETIWGLSSEQFDQLLKGRSAAVADLLEHGLFPILEVR